MCIRDSFGNVFRHCFYISVTSFTNHNAPRSLRWLFEVSQGSAMNVFFLSMFCETIKRICLQAGELVKKRCVLYFVLNFVDFVLFSYDDFYLGEKTQSIMKYFVQINARWAMWFSWLALIFLCDIYHTILANMISAAKGGREHFTFRYKLKLRFFFILWERELEIFKKFLKIHLSHYILNENNLLKLKDFYNKWAS